MLTALRSRWLPVLLASVCLAAGTANAGMHGSQYAPAAGSASDTTRAQKRHFRFYMNAGASWITAPEAGRQHTEPGVIVEGGFEAAPRRGLHVRFGADYQWLPIKTSVSGLLVQGVDLEGNPIGVSFSGDKSGTGGMFGVHVEPELIIMPGTWLLVGGGVAHLSTSDPNAFKAGSVYGAVDGGPPVLVTRAVGPGEYGWAGSWTLGLRRDLRLLGPRVGLELRWGGIETGARPLHMASVRIGW